VEKDSLAKSSLPGGPVSRVLDFLSFAAVSAYLSLVLAFLLLSGRLKPGFSLKSAFLSALAGARRRRRPLGRRRLTRMVAEQGHCFVSALPWGLVSDEQGRSRLKLYEDGQPLGPAHSLHETVRLQGGGAFSHWGNSIYFSTSDNRDPSTSGRGYEIAEEE